MFKINRIKFEILVIPAYESGDQDCEKVVAIEDQLVFTNGGGQIHKLTFGSGFPRNPKDVQVTQLTTLTTEQFT